MKYIDISDAPKYSWRGFHIDISRHFFTKEYIMKIIDELSYYKINKLHLHLTDDQGWRIEIAQFPLLTETGAWRPFNEMDSACMKKAETDSKYIIDQQVYKISKWPDIIRWLFYKAGYQRISWHMQVNISLRSFLKLTCLVICLPQSSLSLSFLHRINRLGY